MKCTCCALSKYEITVDLITQGWGMSRMPGLEKSDMGLRAVSRTGLAFFQLPINSKGAVGDTERELYKINDLKMVTN